MFAGFLFIALIPPLLGLHTPPPGFQFGLLSSYWDQTSEEYIGAVSAPLPEVDDGLHGDSNCKECHHVDTIRTIVKDGHVFKIVYSGLLSVTPGVSFGVKLSCDNGDLEKECPLGPCAQNLLLSVNGTLLWNETSVHEMSTVHKTLTVTGGESWVPFNLEFSSDSQCVELNTYYNGAKLQYDDFSKFSHEKTNVSGPVLGENTFEEYKSIWSMTSMSTELFTLPSNVSQEVQLLYQNSSFSFLCFWQHTMCDVVESFRFGVVFFSAKESGITGNITIPSDMIYLVDIELDKELLTRLNFIPGILYLELDTITIEDSPIITQFDLRGMFYAAPKLKELILKENKALEDINYPSGAELLTLTPNTKMEKLQIKETGVKVLFLTRFAVMFPKLEKLSINGNELMTEMRFEPKMTAMFTKLEEFALKESAITELDLSLLAQLAPDLIEINLESNLQLTDLLVGIAPTAHTNCKVISVVNSLKLEKIGNLRAQFPGLQKLVVEEHGKFPERGFDSKSLPENLNELVFTNGELDASFISEALSDLKKLDIADFSKSRVGVSLSSVLVKTTRIGMRTVLTPVKSNLTELSLADCALSGVIPVDFLQRFPKIQFLDVSDNFLFSHRPAYAWNESNHLEYMQAVTALPEEFLSLTSGVFFLKRSYFDGFVPAIAHPEVFPGIDEGNAFWCDENATSECSEVKIVGVHPIALYKNMPYVNETFFVVLDNVSRIKPNTTFCCSPVHRGRSPKPPRCHNITDTTRQVKFSLFSFPPDQNADELEIKCSVLSHTVGLRIGLIEHCPLGYEFLSSIKRCRKCSRGQYAILDESGKGVCMKCPVNKFSVKLGSLSCRSCPAGKTTEGKTGQFLCKNCPVGTHWEEHSDKPASCVECLEGKFSSTPGSTMCSQCPAGSFGDRIGRTICDQCEAGKYSDRLGVVNCTTCPSNSFTFVRGTSDVKDCECLEGFRFTTAGENQCQPCPVGASCKGGSNPVETASGYWKEGEEYVSCIPEEACKGNNDCENGYIGDLCGTCDKKYYRIGLECIPCSGASRLISIALFIALIAFIGMSFKRAQRLT